MKRNRGTPGDVLAGWSYWKAYTLLDFEMLWRTTGDGRYFDFIKRELDPFMDEQGNLVGVTLDSLDNIMSGNGDRGALRAHRRGAVSQVAVR